MALNEYLRFVARIPEGGKDKPRCLPRCHDLFYDRIDPHMNLASCTPTKRTIGVLTQGLLQALHSKVCEQSSGYGNAKPANEQKQWPHCKVTGPSKNSPHMEQRKVWSKSLNFCSRKSLGSVKSAVWANSLSNEFMDNGARVTVTTCDLSRIHFDKLIRLRRNKDPMAIPVSCSLINLSSIFCKTRRRSEHSCYSQR